MPKAPMKLVNRNLLITLTLFLLVLCSVHHAPAKPRIKVIKLSVTNPSNEPRPREDVVVNVAELKKIAPDFRAGDVIVTTSDAATLEADAGTLQTVELPSQADDLDGDNKFDELVFQIDLRPKQTRIVTIAFGDPATHSTSAQRLSQENAREVHHEIRGVGVGIGFDGVADLFRSAQRNRSLR